MLKVRGSHFTYLFPLIYHFQKIFREDKLHSRAAQFPLLSLNCAWWNQPVLLYAYLAVCDSHLQVCL